MLLTPQVIVALAEVLAPELRGSPNLRQQLASRLRSAATALDYIDEPQQSAYRPDQPAASSTAAAEPPNAAPTQSSQQAVDIHSGAALKKKALTKQLRRTKCKECGRKKMIN